MEEACHSSVKLIGEQWDECVDRFERNYGQINTKMIRTLGKLAVIDNPRTSFIKDDKNYLISVCKYDNCFRDYKSAEAQVRQKLETKELFVSVRTIKGRSSGTNGQARRRHTC